MNRSKLIVLIVLLALLTLAPAAGSAPAAPEAAAPTIVSYQGHVWVDGKPFGAPGEEGGYFKFAVVNAAGDTPYWSNDGSSTTGDEPYLSVKLPVTNGLFSVLLGDTLLEGMTKSLEAKDFGDPETALRVWFSVTGDPASFTQLADRRIAAVPYALVAEEANTARDADTLDGFHANKFQQHYANVVIVAKSGGDFTTITAALDPIEDASSSNPYLVWVAPGVYNEQVTMVPYVDIEGAGELVTRIIWGGGATADTGTVLGMDNAELRNLTVENTGDDEITGETAYAIAINNYHHATRLTHVTATAYGGTSYSIGVQNETAWSEMRSVTANAAGDGNNYGVRNYDCSPAMTDVSAHAWGGVNAYGVYNSYASPVMSGVTALGETGASAYGIYNEYSSPEMNNITARALEGGVSAYGIYNNLSSSPKMNNVVAKAEFGGTNNVGVYNISSSPEMAGVTATASGGAYSTGVCNYYSSPGMSHIVASAQSGAVNYGVSNSYSSPVMSGVTATASGGGSSINYGVHNGDSSPTINNATLSASGGVNNYGAFNERSYLTIQNSTVSGTGGTYGRGIWNQATDGAYAVAVNNCQVMGAQNTISNDSHFVTRVGASQLSGGAVTGGGSVICIGVYDEMYTSLGYNTCP